MNFSENTKISRKNILFLPCFQLSQTAMSRNFVFMRNRIGKDIKPKPVLCNSKRAVYMRFCSIGALFTGFVNFYRLRFKRISISRFSTMLSHIRCRRKLRQTALHLRKSFVNHEYSS